MNTSHVLALVTDAYGGRGGIAQYNRDFLGALARSTAVSSIVILPRHAPDAVRLPSNRMTQMPARFGRVAYTLAALRWALLRRVDVVFCGHLYLAPLAALIAWFKGAKLIVQTYGIEVWHRAPWLWRAAVEFADLVFSISRHTRGAVLSWADIAPECAIVVPVTVGNAFTPGDGSALRAAWRLSGRRVLLTVGRMDSRERYKGHDRVIAAMAAFPQGMQDVTYVIVGEGDDSERLEALARKVGLADRVRFMGAVSHATLVDAYRMADLFVMPSTGEGFGIAFLEAMACGTPALGLAEAGARDALADGELGAAVTEVELPQMIVRLLSESKLDPDGTAANVRRRFGFDLFAQRVGLAFDWVRTVG